ncbi:MAG: acetylglutamate kinase [Candidatus Micrarchaeia archaeon]
MREVLVIKLSGKCVELKRFKKLVPQIAKARENYDVIIVHGGKEQLSSLMKMHGKEPVFRDGRRITDRETLSLAFMAFGGINTEMVSALQEAGVRAVGLTGVDGPTVFGTQDEEMGYEGVATRVDTELIKELFEKYVVVFQPLIYDEKKKTPLNVDADSMATRIARSFGAKMLILGGMKGIVGSDGEIIPKISTKELSGLIENGVVKGGMIPKMEACIEANLPKVWIAGGDEEDIILRALRGDKVGTMIYGR